MKVLFAVDGSKHTKKMLGWLVTHEDLLLGGERHEFTVLNVQHPLPLRVRTALGQETVERMYAEEAARVLEPVQKFLARHGVEAKTMCRTGSVGEAIVRVAESGKFGLLVMGSHGRGALAGMVVGSVASRVLSTSTVPVLLIR